VAEQFAANINASIQVDQEPILTYHALLQQPIHPALRPQVARLAAEREPATDLLDKEAYPTQSLEDLLTSIMEPDKHETPSEEVKSEPGPKSLPPIHD